MSSQPSSLPYVRKGRYGRVTLDHAASGQGYVVDFRASDWVKANWGDKSRWTTFQSFHTALAYFWALSGLHEHPEAGRRVKGSRNAVRTTLDAPEASKLVEALP